MLITSIRREHVLHALLHVLIAQSQRHHVLVVLLEAIALIQQPALVILHTLIRQDSVLYVFLHANLA